MEKSEDKRKQNSTNIEYIKAWKKQRKEKYDLKTATPQDSEQRNMYFFEKIVKTLFKNMSYRQLAAETGYSAQNISWWLISDDCKLSTIYSFFAQLNIKIQCYYTPAKPEKENLKINTDTSIIIDEGVVINRKTASRSNNAIDTAMEKCINMRWLVQFIDDKRWTLEQFSAAIEYKYFTVYEWFRHDDIRISRIYDIARKTGQIVNWKLEQLEAAKEA